MTYLFTRANQELLEMFAWSNVLLAFDYDGTLAPLVTAPTRATMRVSTRRLLRQASTLYPCVVISGRAQDDALGRLRGVDGLSGDRQSWGRTIAGWGGLATSRAAVAACGDRAAVTTARRPH